jgi:UDP-N-acetylmuramoyl-L-alanyl-D-glutamate--2,6-diaminopimelate ligase
MTTMRNYVEACGDLVIEASGDLDVAVTHLTNDSRQVQPGSLFIAIKGERADGREFIPAAIANGAVGVVYAADAPLAVAVPAVRVKDDYVACGLMAELYYDYPARTMLKIAVTGTNGKTTTAFLLQQIFRGAGHKVGMIGTVRYDLGDKVLPADRTTPTPFELQGILGQMRDAKVDVVVMEVSSHALCQRRIGTMCYDAAVFTNLSPEHLDYHKDMENYYQAKKLLFTKHLRRGGAAIINLDDAFGQRLEKELGCRVLTFGFAEKADVRPKAYRLDLGGSELELTSGRLKSPLIGEYNALNVMAAAACAWSWGLGEDTIRRAVENFGGVPGRLQRVPNQRNVNVFIDYAHTGDAMLNVLQTVKPLCRGKLIVVFGCGGNRDTAKRPVMGAVAARFADQVIVTSDNPRYEDPAKIIADLMTGMPAGADVVQEPDRRRAIEQAMAAARPGDTVLLVGKGHEDYQEVGGERHPFNDYDVAIEVLAAASAGTGARPAARRVATRPICQPA